jgi:hypothetical protein
MTIQEEEAKKCRVDRKPCIRIRHMDYSFPERCVITIVDDPGFLMVDRCERCSASTFEFWSERRLARIEKEVRHKQKKKSLFKKIQNRFRRQNPREILNFTPNSNYDRSVI